MTNQLRPGPWDSNPAAVSFPAPPGPHPPGAGIINGWPITQPYSGANGHPGIDLGLPTGTPLLAVTDGVVAQFADGSVASAGGGNWTNLTDSEGTIYGYGHASRFVVPNGARVAAGELIALSGSTGHSTGPHLHFAYRRASSPGGAWQDPTPFLRATVAPPAPPAPQPPTPEDDMPKARWYLNTDNGENWLWIPGLPAQLVEEVAARDAWNAGLLQNGTPAEVPGAFIAGIIRR